MGLTWSFNSDATGYKTLKATVSGGVASTAVVTKYDGSIVKPIADSTSFTAGDQQYLSTSNLFISIADTVSGWLDAWTGTELTADWITAFFNGWAYNGDGTTHSWKSVVDGSAPTTNTLAYVSANKAPNYTPYLLSYQLATPQTVVVTNKVEGDLSLSGLAQASVDGGVIVREKANPSYVSTTEQYYINRYNPDDGSKLNNRTLKILAIYKNGIVDKKWTIQNNPSHSYGIERAYISKADFDTTAEYTVTYTVLDKYSLTVNPLSVPIWYNGNLASTVSSLTDKSSDMATQISVNVAAIVDLYARVKALGG
jgi:hypothetical protein